AIVDDKADMALLLALDGVIGDQRHVDELIAHVDEGVALTLAAQREVEDPAIPGQRLVDIADLDCDMVDADQPRLLCFGHALALSCTRLPRRADARLAMTALYCHCGRGEAISSQRKR